MESTMSVWRALVLAGSPALIAGCPEFGLTPDEDPEDLRILVEERFSQTALPAVDVLLVLDDTASMAQEREALVAHFDELRRALDDDAVAWQLGVVAMRADGPDAGWLRGSPWVMTASDPMVEAQFQAAVRPDASGTGVEAGLAATLAALALTDVDAPNAGFRRPDAALQVLWYSDADDQSDAHLGPDPVTAVVDALAEIAAETGRPAVGSAIVGDLPDGCSGARGDARPGRRYHEAAQRSGGVVGSICADDLGAVLGGLGSSLVTYEAYFPLREAPAADSLRVEVDGLRVLDGWVYEEPPAIRFEPDAIPGPGSEIVARYVVEEVAP